MLRRKYVHHLHLIHNRWNSVVGRTSTTRKFSKGIRGEITSRMNSSDFVIPRDVQGGCDLIPTSLRTNCRVVKAISIKVAFNKEATESSIPSFRAEATVFMAEIESPPNRIKLSSSPERCHS
jgi:hypothetical protein